jgi:hypothetical protein
MPTLIFLFIILPCTVFSQAFRVSHITESLKSPEGTYKSLTRTSSKDTAQITVRVTTDLKMLKMSCYDQTFQIEKQAAEDNQEKVYYRAGTAIAIFNRTKCMVSYWDGVWDNGNKHFIHYYLAVPKL